ncbi:acetolactate synthase 2 catalytic subunit [Parashewanella spongiae]|uniref:Acetolactate synthase n=1 Tax=Parashewanella spongiae TaxID=342950 RepID=A0A3A6TPP6_9GAMM|nr:acetolactate synthase 2 catalytic subunit [Parashewanella spongiae]MCL1079611.1 acetolactate synthase 2 catalytic subunit [Parashewanella spongiae]RJY07189.1 acetolactate synthase 2 catalytic subunit [Parashewanella spongiae]
MANEKSLTGAEQLFEVLKRHGVQNVFGYPGGAIMPIYDALYSYDVNHFLCRHEQGAAFSAIGYARASGKVGVCMATSGPGATNLITALADAMADSIPVIAITGQVPTTAMGSDAFQEIDMIGLSFACTKHSFQVKDVNDLVNTLEQAFSIAQSGRQGPVLIDIPKDIQLKQVTKMCNVLSELQPQQSLNTTQIDLALALLNHSKKPILYVGGGVGMAGAVTELRDFIATTHLPSVTTLKGLGVIDNSDDCYLGMLGMHGTKAANLAVQECDLLIAVGARFDDRVTGKLARFARNAKVIHLDIDCAEIGKRRAVDVAIMCDFKVCLPALAVQLNINGWRNHCRDMKRKFAWNYNCSGDSLYAPAVLNEISKKMSASTIVTTDVGQHQMWAAQHMTFTRPENFLTSGGLGTMGFGLPAAIGAQISRPQDMVINVSGDGSIMMNIQELTTIKRYQLPIKIVLIDNSKLGMVRQWQELFFDGRLSETDLSDNPDFPMLAEAFDIKARMISKKSDVSEAIDQMLSHQGSYLLQIKIDENENVWPLVPPETANEHMLEGASKA